MGRERPGTNEQGDGMPAALIAPPMAALGLGLVGVIIVVLIVIFLLTRIL